MMTPILTEMSTGQWVELGISGVVLVAIGVALFVFIKVANTHSEEVSTRNQDISKREEQLRNFMVAQQEAMEKWVAMQQHSIEQVDDVVNNNKKKPYTVEDDHKTQEFRRFLSETLNQIHTNTHSSRTLYCMYHNGTHSLNNISFYKFSLIDAAWDMNLASVHQRMQNIPAFVYTYRSDMLYANKKGIIIKDIEDLKENVATYQFFKDRCVKGFVAQGVYDEENNILLGFIINEYIDIPNSWTDSDWKDIKTQVTRGADKISGVLQVTPVDEQIREQKLQENQGGEHDGY